MSITRGYGRLFALRFHLAALLCLAAGGAKADPLKLKVLFADPLVNVGGLGGGRFAAKLDGQDVYVHCIDFGHHFHYGREYSAFVTPLYGGLDNTRYGSTTSWQYGTFSALERYMMAAWLTSQYAPFFATWSDNQSKHNARGIQSAIWTLLDPAGDPNAPSGGNRDFWLQQAVDFLAMHNDPADDFYRYFRVVTPFDRNGKPRQEFMIQVTPEPAGLLLAGTVLGVLALRMWARRGRKVGTVSRKGA